MSAPKAVLNVLREKIGAVTSEIDDSQLEYLASMCGDFCAQGNFDAEEWAEAVGPILGEWLEDEAAVAQVCAEVIKRLDPALAVKPVQGDQESEVRVGDKCEGKFYEDEQWYNVEVMGVTGPDAFYVCFLEYGNVETVTRSELRNVPLHATAVVAPMVVPEVAVAELNFREMSMKDRVLLHMEQMHLGFMSGRMLLVKTDLHLERGHRYGLVGQNGAGKTTLMRRIAKKDMPSFPISLNVVFVEHEIAGDQVNKTVTEFMMAAGFRQGIADLDEERARSILATVGFGEDKRTSSVKELSGGWRMRLAIAQALLSDADILCLDEPTNHLDVHAVAWLEKFLSGLNDVCVVVVSHDPSFLDAVITDVVLIKEQQLNTFHGNFTDFTQQQSHFTMEDLKSSNAGTGKSTLTFRFPEPEKLIGVASTRAILKMAAVNFAYGAKKAAVLSDVEAKLMLVSRVAVLGENGAGKSTLVKIIVGELYPEIGKVWRHHNLRVAYVAQHSFFHLEELMETTACGYIQQRFGRGFDKESTVVKRGQELADTDRKDVPKELEIDYLVGRRKYKREMEYEVRWKGKNDTSNSWLPLSMLRKRGERAMQLAAEMDESMRNARSGLDQRSLVAKEVIQHLADFGLKRDVANAKIEQLSGGQRSRLVLAAAMWNKPHLLVLDEPTNFLDQEALDALRRSLKKFKGGVIMVSHHEEFVMKVCSEVWRVADGVVKIEQKSYDIQAAAYNAPAAER